MTDVPVCRYCKSAKIKRVFRKGHDWRCDGCRRTFDEPRYRTPETPYSLSLSETAKTLWEAPKDAYP